MPTVAVYVSAADARSLEAEGKKVDEWVREVVKTGLSERGGVAEAPHANTAVASEGAVPRPRSESPAAKRSYEHFSLVCSNRANHEAGVYCPECKGDGGR